MKISSVVGRFLQIKKESPNKGTETRLSLSTIHLIRTRIKKESPNKGTETPLRSLSLVKQYNRIKKESPNKGTETRLIRDFIPRWLFYKKRIPE